MISAPPVTPPEARLASASDATLVPTVALNVTGNLKDWDVTARLGEIGLPVLVTSGGYDEMTPALVEPLVAGISGAEHAVFRDSAHLAMAEEPDRYRQVLGSFLDRVEAGKQA